MRRSGGISNTMHYACVDVVIHTCESGDRQMHLLCAHTYFVDEYDIHECDKRDTSRSIMLSTSLNNNTKFSSHRKQRFYYI